MNARLWFSAAVVATGLMLQGSAVWAQQFGGGGGGGGGGFGGGGGGFGGGGGQGGGGAGLNQSFLGNQMNQSLQGLPTILMRQSQGVFGTRAVGSSSRQRYRMFMGSSQAGGGGARSQYANSGAFSQNRRGTLPGSGMLTVSSLTGPNAQPQQQQRAGGQAGQANPNQRAGAAPVARKTTVRVGFETQGPPPQQITSNLRQHLSRVPALGPTSASLVGRTVVLRGSVTTDHARDLAERLALLEPGIDVVRNELTTNRSTHESPRGQELLPPAGPTAPQPGSSNSGPPAPIRLVPPSGS